MRIVHLTDGLPDEPDENDVEAIGKAPSIEGFFAALFRDAAGMDWPTMSDVGEERNDERLVRTGRYGDAALGVDVRTVTILQPPDLMVRCHWETHGLPGTKVTWEYYLESAEEPVPKAYRHNLLECEFDTAADQARFAQIWKDQIGKTPVFMTVMSAPEASMANSFGRDILIQAEDAEAAARFYVEQLGFRVTDPNPKMIGLSGPNITLYIEPGPALGPVLEVFVDDVEAAKRRLVEAGATIIKDEPAVPRVYLRDPQGLIYNLAKKS